MEVDQKTITNWIEDDFRKKLTADNFLNSPDFTLWQPCYIQEEIAAAVEVTRQAVAVWEEEFAKKLAIDNFANSPDFTL